MLLGQFPLADEAGNRTDSREINVNHHINRLYAEWCLMRVIPEEVDEDTGIVVVERRLDRIDPSFIPVGVSLRFSYRVLPTDYWRALGEGSYNLRDVYHMNALNMGSGQIRIECPTLPSEHVLAIQLNGAVEGIEWLSSQE